MKKMIMMAVMVSAMLMPAQMMAKNDNNRKPVAVEKRDKQDNRTKVRVNNKHIEKNTKEVKGNRQKVSAPAAHKPAPAPVVVHKPAPVVVHQPAPVVIHKPAPVVVHHPAPVVVHQPAPVVVHHPAPVVSVCNSEAASVAAVAIGVVGLLSLRAN